MKDEMIAAHWGKVHTRAHVEASTPDDRAEELRQELLGRLDHAHLNVSLSSEFPSVGP